MDTTVLTKVLNHPDYVLSVVHHTDDNSYVGKIMATGKAAGSSEGPNLSGETLFVSFPQSTVEEAEKAAADYYIQLNKPKPEPR